MPLGQAIITRPTSSIFTRTAYSHTLETALGNTQSDLRHVRH